MASRLCTPGSNHLVMSSESLNPHSPHLYEKGFFTEIGTNRIYVHLLYVYVYVCIYIYILCICICVCVSVCVCVCVCVHVGLLWWHGSKESTCNARDPSWTPGSGRSSGGGHGNPLQYSCLENPMDRGAWGAEVHRVAKSWTWLKWLNTHMYICIYKTRFIVRNWLVWFYCGWEVPQLLFVSWRPKKASGVIPVLAREPERIEG